MWAHTPNSFRAAMSTSPRGLQPERGVGCHPRGRLGDVLSFPDPGMAGGQVIGVSTSGETPRHGLDHGSSGNLSLVTAFTPSPHGSRAPLGPPPPRTPTPRSRLPVPHPPAGRWPSASQLRADWRQGVPGPRTAPQGWSGGVQGARLMEEAKVASVEMGAPSWAEIGPDGRAAALLLRNL